MERWHGGFRLRSGRHLVALACLVGVALTSGCTVVVDADALDAGCDGQTKLCDDRCVSTTDPDYSCGRPGCSPCSLDNATPSCSPTGECIIAGCLPGYEDCDGVATNGCEINTRTDADNCGLCGVSCDTPPNGERDCANSICAIRKCAEDWDDCNGRADDGCETDLTTDAGACGDCDTACAVDEVCDAGTCR